MSWFSCWWVHCSFLVKGHGNCHTMASEYHLSHSIVERRMKRPAIFYREIVNRKRKQTYKVILRQLDMKNRETRCQWALSSMESK